MIEFVLKGSPSAFVRFDDMWDVCAITIAEFFQNESSSFAMALVAPTGEVCR